MKFRKYHGLGNDFIIVDCRDGASEITADWVRWVCDRRRGVGADGVLAVWSDDEAGRDAVDARMDVHNADGSTAGMCGNGLRCVARFLYDVGAVDASKSSLTIRIGDGTYRCDRLAADRYRVAMGRVVTEHADLPRETNDGVIELALDGRKLAGTPLSLGNPHLVIFVGDDDPEVLARTYGAELEAHGAFPKRVNVSFVRRCAPGGFEAVVFERGVGITQACGSGACAVGVAAVQRGHWEVGEPMQVWLPGGALEITVAEDGSVAMEGEAVCTFIGEVDLP